ncbi:MAG: hypothetical protein E7395_08305, partial [Ruminococcaceae bacterium]|nr:hypothetical protein [Oscillospiraceae bacterium]
MKKTIVYLLSLVLTFGSLCAFAADKPESLKFNADPSERSVEICDKVCGNGGKYVTVSIASQSKCETSFSKDNTPDIFDVYLLDEEGKIGKNIKFSDKLGVGRYNIFINEKLMFYTIYRDSDAPETLGLIDELNKAADSSAIKKKVFEGSNREILGIDREDTVLNGYLDKYCDISADVRKANVGGKFTSESFYDGLFDFIVCDMLASGSLEQAVTQYGDTLGTSFDEYNQ